MSTRRRPGMARWSAAERRALAHYQRARARGSDTDYRAEDWALLVWWFGGVCLCCGADEVTIDHVVPLARGGSNTITNLAPLCRRCNAAKGTRTIDYRDPARLVQVLEMLGL